MYPLQLPFLEGPHPWRIADIQLFDFGPPLHLGSSFLLRGRGMRFSELHRKELGILSSLASSYRIGFCWVIFLIFATIILSW